jgi:tRNA pseudouridine13 synthase
METMDINVFSKKILSGKIKEKPEDFIVEEITPEGKVCSISYTFLDALKDNLPKKRKEYIHFTLVKKNWTTIRAISEISKKLRVSKQRFGYAGTKDKKAITAQRVSVWNTTIDKLKKVKLGDITIKDFEYSDNRIHLGELYGNRFTITIRDYSLTSEKELIKTANGKIPNFFGPQRFGVQRRVNHLVGKQLLLGNFEGAMMLLITKSGNENKDAVKARKFAAENWGDWKKILRVWPKTLGVEAAVLNYLAQYPKDYANAFRKLPKKLRRMFIHAFQSYIFNKTLSEVIKRGIEVKEIPIVGYKTELKGEVGEIIKEILKEEDITPSLFKLKRMPELSEKGEIRKAFFKVEDFKIVKRTKEKLVLRFTLKKGIYATTLLSYLGVEV